MTRHKKTRKPGIGIAPKISRQQLDQQAKEQKRVKKRKGLNSGSRNSAFEANVDTKNNQQSVNDKRHGSKKPIALQAVQEEKHVDFQPQVVLKKVDNTPDLPPEKELEMIESDMRLLDLMDRQDSGEVLQGKDAKYFQRQVKRHQELMDILGIEEEDDEDDTENTLDDFLENSQDEWSEWLDDDKK